MTNLFYRLRQELLKEEFSEGDTSGAAKDEIEKETFKIVSAIAPAAKDDYGITLVGEPNGLVRHFEEFASIGIDKSHLIIVERVEDLYNKLKKELQTNHMDFLDKKENRIPRFETYNQLINADFYEVLKSAIKKKKKFNFVDFDGTDSLDAYHFEMIDFYKENMDKIKSMRILFSPRNTNSAAKNIIKATIKKLGIKSEKYYPMNRMDICKAIDFELKKENSNLKQTLSIDDLKSITKKLESGFKNSNFKVNVESKIPDETMFCWYAFSQGFYTLSRSYKSDRDAIMQNVLLSPIELNGYQTEKFLDGTRLLYNDTVEKVVCGHKIKVFDTKRGSTNQKAYSADTGYYLINNTVYHNKYGKLIDMTLFQKVF